MSWSKSAMTRRSDLISTGAMSTSFRMAATPCWRDGSSGEPAAVVRKARFRLIALQNWLRSALVWAVGPAVGPSLNGSLGADVSAAPGVAAGSDDPDVDVIGGAADAGGWVVPHPPATTATRAAAKAKAVTGSRRWPVRPMGGRFRVSG